MSKLSSKLRAVPQWELDAQITVVLFAGLGGACIGLEEAGCPVHVANNHDPIALAAHAALHPHTRHVKGDIFDIDPIDATNGRPVKVLWASPDCRDHSVAKGGAPRSARIRSLPWQVCRWAGKTHPMVIMMENVREIRGWGPLVAKRCSRTGRLVKLDGSVSAKGEHVPLRQQQLARDRKRVGRSYRRFVAHIRGLGYAYGDQDLCCADFGVPTTRRRWFAVARRDGRPIAWPARTHAPIDQALSLGLRPWVGAHTIIDWSLPLPSIFERSRPLAVATERRIAIGFRRYVLESPRPFIVPVCHSGSPSRTHDGRHPLPTMTTAKGGEFAVISPVLAGLSVQVGYGERTGQAPRALDVQAPLGTVVAGGGKHAVVGAWMAQHNLNAVGVKVDSPLSTLTTLGTQQQVCGAFMTKLRGTSIAEAMDAPVPTLSAGGNHMAATAAFLVKYYGEGSVSQDVVQPLHTLSCLARFGVVTVQSAGETYAVTDIGMRMLEPKEAAAAHELTLPEAIMLDGTLKALTKREAMRLIGNSVPKRMATLIAQANRVHALDVATVRQVAAE